MLATVRWPMEYIENEELHLMWNHRCGPFVVVNELEHNRNDGAVDFIIIFGALLLIPSVQTFLIDIVEFCTNTRWTKG